MVAVWFDALTMEICDQILSLQEGPYGKLHTARKTGEHAP